MSTVLPISKLPPVNEVQAGDKFVIERFGKNKQVDFANIIFGLDNVTFAATISSQSTEIVALSTDVANLSSNFESEKENTQTYIGNAMSLLSAGMIDVFYPINCIKFSVDNVNPGTYLPNTTWDQVAEGQFVAGVGQGADKNGDTLSVDPESTSNNQDKGEYNHTLTTAELPNHSHRMSSLGLGNADGNDTLASQGVLFNYIGSAGAASNDTTEAGSGNAHNNIPPLFGLYVWKRIG